MSIPNGMRGGRGTQAVAPGSCCGASLRFLEVLEEPEKDELGSAGFCEGEELMCQFASDIHRWWVRAGGWITLKRLSISVILNECAVRARVRLINSDADRVDVVVVAFVVEQVDDGGGGCRCVGVWRGVRNRLSDRVVVVSLAGCYM